MNIHDYLITRRRFEGKRLMIDDEGKPYPSPEPT